MELALDQIVEGAKIAGIIVGSSIACLTAALGGVVGIMKLAEKKYLMGHLKELYNNGKLNRKPTYLNVNSFYTKK